MIINLEICYFNFMFIVKFIVYILNFFSELFKTDDVIKTEIEKTFDDQLIKMITQKIHVVVVNVSKSENHTKESSNLESITSHLMCIMDSYFLLCYCDKQTTKDVFNMLTQVELFINTLPELTLNITKETTYDEFREYENYANNKEKLKILYSAVYSYFEDKMGRFAILKKLFKSKTIKHNFTKETIAHIIMMYDIFYLNTVENLRSDNSIKSQIETLLNAKIINGLKNANFDEESINKTYDGKYILSSICTSSYISTELLDLVLDIGADARKYIFMEDTILTGLCRNLKFDIVKKIFAKNPEKFIVNNNNCNITITELMETRKKDNICISHRNLIHIVLESYFEKCAKQNEEFLMQFISFLINDMKIDIDTVVAICMGNGGYDYKRLTPFQYCVMTGQFKIADLFVGMGANINILYDEKSIIWNMFTKGYCYMPRDCTNIIKYLLEKNVNIISPMNKTCQSPYEYYKINKPSHFACLDGLIEQVYLRQSTNH